MGSRWVGWAYAIRRVLDRGHAVPTDVTTAKLKTLCLVTTDTFAMRWHWMLVFHPHTACHFIPTVLGAR